MTRLVGLQGETAVSIGPTGHAHDLPAECAECEPHMIKLGFVYEGEEEVHKQNEFERGRQQAFDEIARRAENMQLDPAVVDALLPPKANAPGVTTDKRSSRRK